MYNDIRNIVVHKGGKIYNNEDDKRANRVRQFINAGQQQAIGLVSQADYHYIEFTEEFCPEVINNLRTFFSELQRRINSNTRLSAPTPAKSHQKWLRQTFGTAAVAAIVIGIVIMIKSRLRG